MKLFNCGCCHSSDEQHDEVVGQAEVSPVGLRDTLTDVTSNDMPRKLDLPVTPRGVNEDQTNGVVEDSKRRNEEIRQQVLEFAKAALAGCRCQIVDPISGRMQPAVYSVDKQLKNFTVTIKELNETESIPFAAIAEFATFERSAVVKEYPTLNHTLNADNREHFVSVEYYDLSMSGSPQAETHSAVNIVEVDRKAKQFIRCMQCLKLYSINRAAKKGDSLA
eukprot:Platyproteum_vivax@DN3059_c0_g1_i1.p1